MTRWNPSTSLTQRYSIANLAVDVLALEDCERYEGGGVCTICAGYAELLNSDLQVRCVGSVYSTSEAGLLLLERKQCNDQWISLGLQRVKVMNSAYMLDILCC